MCGSRDLSLDFLYHTFLLFFSFAYLSYRCLPLLRRMRYIARIVGIILVRRECRFCVDLRLCLWYKFGD